MSTILEVSSVSEQDGNIFEALKKAAHDGDIERLYELLKEDANLLSHFDKIQFCETPLHSAAANGQVQFAIEVMNLMPSLAWKLNTSGQSPIHLALENKHTRLVRAFVAIESSLVGIKGRGRLTPLHHVASIGDVDLLSEFLYACPSSLEDLTIKCETVVHLAVKNHQISSFKVLLGWIKRVNKEDILDWKNIDGNTVNHIAASINQTEVMKLLRNIVKVTAKNLDGKTATDILRIHQSRSPEAKTFVDKAKQTLFPRSTKTLAEYLSMDLSFMEKQNSLLGIRNVSMTRNGSPNTSSRRNDILVVAILVASATFAVILCPPGGYWQDTVEYHHVAGQMIMSSTPALIFVLLTALAFLFSQYLILTLTITLPMWKLVYGSTAFLGLAISVSYSIVFPFASAVFQSFIMHGVFFYAFPLTILVMPFAIFVVFTVDKRRRQQVDFPASSFSLSQSYY